MTRRHPGLGLLGLLAGLAAVAAAWLLLHNPTVESTSQGRYTCSAPYDTVLFDADNVPGGEPPADADVVEARCTDLGAARFRQGSLAAAAAAALAALTALSAVRGRRSHKPDEGAAASSRPPR
jgi:hypothetical protein